MVAVLCNLVIIFRKALIEDGLGRPPEEMKEIVSSLTSFIYLILILAIVFAVISLAKKQRVVLSTMAIVTSLLIFTYVAAVVRPAMEAIYGGEASICNLAGKTGVCIDFAPNYPRESAVLVCSQVTGEFSTAAQCPNEGKIGKCGNTEQVFNFYDKFYSDEMAQAICAKHSYQYEALAETPLSTAKMSCSIKKESLCTDFTSGITDKMATYTCEFAKGVFSNTPCPVENRIGSCSVAILTTVATRRYFTPKETQVAEEDCREKKGVYTPN